MKAILFLLFTFSAVFHSFTQQAQDLRSASDHLITVNKLWTEHAEFIPSENISFESENARIKYHLLSVIELLRKTEDASFDFEQRLHRDQLLTQLEGYAKAQVFPQNIYHSERRPYFVDHLGTHCAVGYLIHSSGNDDLVTQIVKEHNYDYLRDIRTEGVLDWAINFGFKADELALIQPTYSPASTIDTIGNGTNGPVKKMKVDNWNGRLLFAGDFSIVDFENCANVGVYEDGQLSCLGGGVNGQVNDIVRFQDGVYVFGALEYNGEIYPIAKYDEISWTYIGIPGREGASATTGNYAGQGNAFQVAIHPNNQLDMQELWTISSIGVWEQNAEVDGEIYVIEFSEYGRVYAGKFETVQVFNSGIVDTVLSVNNVVFKENYDDDWFGISGEISDTVKTVQIVGSALYFGGTCTFDAGGSSPCLSRYLNSSLQTVISRTWFDENVRISMNSLYFDYDQSLYIGGEFPIQPMMGTQGANLAKFDLIYNSLEGLAMTDKPICALLKYDGKIYLGGEFETNLYEDTVHHFGRLDNVANVNSVPKPQTLVAFPNPFSDLIQVEGIAANASYSITDVQGREIQIGNLENGVINGLGHLPRGIYNLVLFSNGQRSVCKLLK